MASRTLTALTLTAALAVPLALPARAADRSAEIKKSHAQVQALFDRLMAADGRGDAVAVAALYDTEGMLLPPSGPPVKGREEIQKRYEALFASATLEVAMKSDELWVFDDWAISRGTTSGRAVPKAGGAPRPVHDKYLLVMKRSGDGWSIHNLMWSPMN